MCSLLAGCTSQQVTRSGEPTRSDDRVVVRGELTDDDDLWEGVRYDSIVSRTWAPGETIRVWMESESFDTVVLVEVLGEDRAYENDDYTGYEPHTATYVSYIEETNTSGRPLVVEIRASAYSEDDLGTYSLWYAFSPANTSGSPPTDLPPEPETPEASGGELSHTSNVTGQLRADTPVYDGGDTPDLRADLYALTLQEDEAVYIRLRSDDFRPEIVAQLNGADPLTGIHPLDGEGDVTMTLLDPGEYFLLVGSTTRSPLGAYELSIRPTEPGLFLTERFVLNERTFRGEIDNFDDYVVITEDGDEREADTHDVELRAGQVLSLNLLSSDFDPVLVLKRGDAIIAFNDDFQGLQNNSQIRDLTIPVTGTYTIVVAAYDETGSGTYFLDGRAD